jgi:plasmid stabilization system protein ParE
MDKLPIDYHPEARIETEAAFDWYHEKSPRAAERFYVELERAHTAIQNSPKLWAKYMYGTRRYLLERYPYIVVYRVAMHRIEVIAVAHGSRQPGYWANRLERSQ